MIHILHQLKTGFSFIIHRPWQSWWRTDRLPSSETKNCELSGLFNMNLWKPCLWSSDNFSLTPKNIFPKINPNQPRGNGLDLIMKMIRSDQVKVLWHSALLRWLLEHPVDCPSFDHNKKLSVQLPLTSGNCWLHKKLLEFILILCCFNVYSHQFDKWRSVRSSFHISPENLRILKWS